VFLYLLTQILTIMPQIIPRPFPVASFPFRYSLIISSFDAVQFEVLITYLLTYSVALVRNQTIPAERPPLVGEVSANFCG
jgi:hypothetical protein